MLQEILGWWNHLGGAKGNVTNQEIASTPPTRVGDSPVAYLGRCFIFIRLAAVSPGYRHISQTSMAVLTTTTH